MGSKFMSNVSVPLEIDVIERVDKIVYEKDYKSRSEYIRLAVKEKISKDAAETN